MLAPDRWLEGKLLKKLRSGIYRKILSVLENMDLAEMIGEEPGTQRIGRGASICFIQNKDISLFGIMTKQVFSMKGNPLEKME